MHLALQQSRACCIGRCTTNCLVGLLHVCVCSRTAAGAVFDLDPRSDSPLRVQRLLRFLTHAKEAICSLACMQCVTSLICMGTCKHLVEFAVGAAAAARPDPHCQLEP